MVLKSKTAPHTKAVCGNKPQKRNKYVNIVVHAPHPIVKVQLLMYVARHNITHILNVYMFYMYMFASIIHVTHKTVPTACKLSVRLRGRVNGKKGDPMHLTLATYLWITRAGTCLLIFHISIEKHGITKWQYIIFHPYCVIGNELNLTLIDILNYLHVFSFRLKNGAGIPLLLLPGKIQML